MLAITQQFGGADVLAATEVERPTPIPTEVKVQVHAAGVNPVDARPEARGTLRSWAAADRIGWDISGVVAEVVAGVTRFAVGDEVFGMPWFPREPAPTRSS